MSRWIRPIFLAFACLVGQAHATIVQSLSVEEMSRKADVVVVGRVAEQSTGWNETRSRIYTVTTVEVTEYVKGLGETRIQVRQLGGTVDGLSQTIVGNARLAVGEEVVLFLNRDLSKGLHYVVGMAQGKFSIDRQTPVPTLRRDLAGLSAVRITQGTALDGPAVPAASTLDQLKAQVADALKSSTP